jgi:hypothetical protein
VVAAPTERGQLILVGAITIALIIVGLSVIVNTVLFTESVGSSSLDNRIDETGEYDAEAIAAVRSLVFRIGHDSRNITEAELRARVASNVTTYSRASAMSYAGSRPVAVSVEYSNASRLGNRTVQDTDWSVTDENGADDWTIVTDKTVGWFTLNVDVLDTDATQTHINTTNATSGRWVNVSINRTTSGNVSVTSAVSFTGGASATCQPVDGRVLFDMYEGVALTDSAGSCAFNGTALLDAPYSVSVVDGTNLVGKYSLVTKEPVTGPETCNGEPPSRADPCVAPVVWTANISTAFEGESISHVNTYNVSIYGEPA